MMQVFQAVVAAGTPALALYAARRSRAVAAVGPVALCYALGIVLGNTLPLDARFAMDAGGLFVVLAIPLLLFSVDVPAWLGSAPSTVLASLLAFVAVGSVTTAVGTACFEVLSRTPEMAAGLAAMYTGGTPSMAAISKALRYPPELFVALNAADIVVSGPYYLLLVAAGHRIFGLFLKAPAPRPGDELDTAGGEPGAPLPARALVTAFLLSAAIAGASVGLSQLVSPDGRDVSVIVLVSTLAIAASSLRRVRTLPGTSRLGEYLLLMFCVCVGSLADLDALRRTDPLVFAFTGAVFLLSQAAQLALFSAFRVDRDTALMATLASIYSPPFVAPVAARLGRKQALVTGVTIGLVGYAVAVYVGLAVAWLVRALH